MEPQAQGGEVPVVVVALSPDHDPLLTRKLLYTAVTRAQHRLVLVASRAAVEACVSDAGLRRGGMQRQWLKAFAAWRKLQRG